MKVLIVGAGIGGLTLALCLRRAGHAVVVLEKSPRLRDEGYMIDFFGSGYDAAERLGLLPAIARVHYPVGAAGLPRRRRPRALRAALPGAAQAPVRRSPLQLHARRFSSTCSSTRCPV